MKKRTPISADIIKLIIDNVAGPQSSLKHLRIATCTLGFAGFLRYNELCNILPSHLNFYDTYMTIFIPFSKTDVYREGNIAIAALPLNFVAPNEIKSSGTRVLVTALVCRFMSFLSRHARINFTS